MTRYEELCQIPLQIVSPREGLKAHSHKNSLVVGNTSLPTHIFGKAPTPGPANKQAVMLGDLLGYLNLDALSNAPGT